MIIVSGCICSLGEGILSNEENVFECSFAWKSEIIITIKSQRGGKEVADQKNEGGGL